jgi:hypothetical protein
VKRVCDERCSQRQHEGFLSQLREPKLREPKKNHRKRREPAQGLRGRFGKLTIAGQDTIKPGCDRSLDELSVL